MNNANEKTEVAKITGKFTLAAAIIGAIITGVFLLANTAIQNGSILIHTEVIENDIATIVGDWEGTIRAENDSFSSPLSVSIFSNCKLGSICGTVIAHSLPCSGDIKFIGEKDGVFQFVELNMAGSEFCADGGNHYLSLTSRNEISDSYHYQSGNTLYHSSATLSRK